MSAVDGAPRGEHARSWTSRCTSPTSGRQDAGFFARVSAELLSEAGEGRTPQAVVEGIVRVVPACDSSSLSIRRGRRPVTDVAATSDLATSCDRMQDDLAEGPSLDVVRDSTPAMRATSPQIPAGRVGAVRSPLSAWGRC